MAPRSVEGVWRKKLRELGDGIGEISVERQEIIPVTGANGARTAAGRRHHRKVILIARDSFETRDVVTAREQIMGIEQLLVDVNRAAAGDPLENVLVEQIVAERLQLDSEAQ